MTKLKAYSGFKVGIVWRGNPAHKNDHNRSIKSSAYAPFLQIPGISIINLQKDATTSEILALNAKDNFLNAETELHDLSDAAALIANLDLIISVDTSICHLAGALGIPIWTLITFVPDWRWLLDREDSPWYPTMKLFRQPEIDDWASVIDKIQSSLKRLVDGREDKCVAV